MTRFGDGPAWLARSVLAATLALIVIGLVLSANPISLARYTVDPTISDTALYKAVAERVSKGEGYYEAAFIEHRARGYPLKPFVTVRLPTLAWINAAFGPSLVFVVLQLLTVSAIVAACMRLRESFQTRWGQVGVVASAAFGAVAFVDPLLVVWHEVWAALLISLSLACWGTNRYAASVLLGVAAACIRELALPFLAVMGGVALLERRRDEALAWFAGMVGVMAGIGIHAMEVSLHVLDGDKASPGWASFGGWKLALTMIQDSSLLTWLHVSVTAIVAPLALLGWAAWKSPTGTRGFLIVAGYCCGFMMFGRANNSYWGVLLAPIFFIGLAFAPAALFDLVRAARRSGKEPSLAGR